MKRRFAVLVVLIGLGFISNKAFAQATSSTTGANTILTGVPFLTIAPDSRAGAMGDAGVASSPDMNSQHWNPAKYAFIGSEMGIGLSYTPWLRNLVDDINLAYLVGYKRLDDLQTVSASLRYFSLGDISFMSEFGDFQGQQSPNEFAFDVGYTRLLSEEFSGSVAMRYIRSDLTGGQLVNGVPSTAGQSFAADIAFYYQNEMRVNRKESTFSAGINIQNIGAKISYTDGETKDFIPTNLKLGVGYETEMDQYNTIGFYFDINKLLVPTPNSDSVDIVGGGFSDDKSVIAGMFSSFGDAPGGMKEELQEITLSFGAEYWYNEQFALRAGYFHEHENKGNRKFITAGAGLKLNVFALDFSYLIPTQRNHPLENTLRFSLSFDFESFSSQRR
ncbi:type IX secretion system outer membrane channel protein PorV [uncultured Sunxiuqinia sp.]|uniref:type IX secretion system outer membrane channel protein PorV n=1 Tax=uncultured Sunxiuqinia sp. TaxID=1573825 RepID=UPI0030D8D634|tara:strand:- start:95384 stop:96550 length:1167 start_codon:yes stop_codon:yes gene_type:complete